MARWGRSSPIVSVVLRPKAAPSVPTQAGSVDLVAVSTLTADASRSALASVDLTTTSTLTTSGIRQADAVVSMTATSALTTSGVRQADAVVSMTVISTLTTSGLRQPEASVALVAISTLTTTATVTGVNVTAVDMVGTSTLTVTAVRAQLATVTMTDVSTLSTTGLRTPQGSVALVATSTLTATAVRQPVATAALIASSTLTTGGIRAAVSSVPMTAVFTLTAQAVRTAEVTASLVATSTLSTSGVRERVGSVPFSATSTLIVTAVRTQPAVVAFVATSTLTIGPVLARAGSVAMVATATLTVTGIAAPPELGKIPNAAHTGFLWALDVDLSWHAVEWPTLPFRPYDLAGLVTWLDAVDYTSGSWPNKGSGPAVTIVGTPAMTVSANTLNSKKLVRFTVNEGRLRSAWPYPPEDWTVSYVVRWVGTVVGRAFTVQYPPSNLLVGFHTTGQDSMYDNGAWIGPGGSSASAWGSFPGPWKIYTADSDSIGNGQRFYFNGVTYGPYVGQAGQGFFNGWGISGYDAVGIQETMDIEVAELVIYNRRLPDVDRVKVEDYLKTKWALT